MLNIASLSNATFEYGDVKSDFQAYMVDKRTTNLLFFRLCGEAAEAVLFSTDLKSFRPDEAQLDRYKLKLDVSGSDLGSAINAKK